MKSTTWWAMPFLQGRLWRRKDGPCIGNLPFFHRPIHFCLNVGWKGHPPLRIIFPRWQPIWCLLGLVRECAVAKILLKWCSGSQLRPLLGTLISVLLPRRMREGWKSWMPLWDTLHFRKLYGSLLSRLYSQLRWNVNSFLPPVINKCDTSWRLSLLQFCFHCISSFLLLPHLLIYLILLSFCLFYILLTLRSEHPSSGTYHAHFIRFVLVRYSLRYD